MGVGRLARDRPPGRQDYEFVARPVEEVIWKCEQAVRNYPCISCATHFLKVELDRT
jgi:hypothetical protein